MTGNIVWLQRWYLSQCNQDWEHQYGVQIGTIDNPGWTLSIDLQGTELETPPFTAQKIERTEEDWVHCWVADGKFQAACGPENLEEALGAFRKWATENGSTRRLLPG